MIIMINGPFGVGKTSLAMELQRRFSGSAIFDPELLGEPAEALTRHVRKEGEGEEDFQDIRLWSWLIVDAARRLQELYAHSLIVPMSFDNIERLRFVRSGFAAFDTNIRHFCLRAPYPVIAKRLEERGESNGEWVHRRARECCERQTGPDFERYIEAESRGVEMIAQEIVSLIACP